MTHPFLLPFPSPFFVVQLDAASPLHHAAEEGEDLVIAALISMGADVDEVDSEGQTPLMVAASWGNAGACTLLAGAYTRPLHSSAWADSDTKAHPKHPLIPSEIPCTTPKQPLDASPLPQKALKLR
jgi:hypothetical protein